ncbi:MAG TPA: capsule biosynthesis protein CapD, partial [Opitutae bacterium]|nr:capsule biosynthesis protein CapD [Opitutae bacterium]
MPPPNGTSQHPIRRALISAAFYGSLLAAALWLAYDIRFLDGFKFGLDTTHRSQIFANRPMALLWAIPLKLVLLIAFGQFKGILYYFRLRDALRLGVALLLSSVAIYLIILSGPFTEIPRGVLLIDFNLSLIFCMIFRTGIRVWKEATDKSDEVGTVERIAIVGAGSAGAQLAADIQSRRGHGLKPICFLDDDVDKHGLEIHGLPVLGAPEKLAFLKDRLELTEVILALPTVSARRIREVTAICAENSLRTLVVPSLRELATGRVRTSDIRPVSLEDLLGRMPAQLDEHAIDSIAEGRVVLVSGAGGSIGSEIARQIAARRPARLLILDQCEVLLYQVEQDLINMGYGAVITPLVADVTDVSRMDAIFAKYRPGLVLHAAAHKHVPMM